MQLTGDSRALILTRFIRPPCQQAQVFPRLRYLPLHLLAFSDVNHAGNRKRRLLQSQPHHFPYHDDISHCATLANVPLLEGIACGRPVEPPMYGFLFARPVLRVRDVRDRQFRQLCAGIADEIEKATVRLHQPLRGRVDQCDADRARFEHCTETFLALL